MSYEKYFIDGKYLSADEYVERFRIKAIYSINMIAEINSSSFLRNRYLDESIKKEKYVEFQDDIFNLNDMEFYQKKKNKNIHINSDFDLEDMFKNIDVQERDIVFKNGLDSEISDANEIIPCIFSIFDVFKKTENKSITCGKLCKLKGQNLKLTNKDSSIEIIIVDESENEIKDFKPFTVSKYQIYKNTSNELYFCIPESLPVGKKCKIRIKTGFSLENNVENNFLIADSCSLTIK